MNDVIGRMAQQLVDDPDEVKVNLIESGDMPIFRLKVTKEDVGKAIGR